MIIALASPRVATSVDDGLDKIKTSLSEASPRGAAIVCFPEAYLPGLRGQDFDVVPCDETDEQRVRKTVAEWARTFRIATILGIEKLSAAGPQISACVFDADGRHLGDQTKNQLDPSEERFYVPGTGRRLFEV